MAAPCRHEPVGVVQRERERLLDEDVAPRVERGNRDGGMIAGRREDPDDVGRIGGEKGADIGKPAGDAELVRDAGSARGIAIDDGLDARAADPPERWQMLEFADLAAADERDPDWRADDPSWDPGIAQLY
jgi:hypothetical protein